MDQAGIIAIGLLTRRDLERLGPAFKWAWPVDEAPSFTELLIAIDEAEEEMRARGGGAPPRVTGRTDSSQPR